MNPISIVKRKLAVFNEVKYARDIGVRIGDNCRIISTPNWGSEPWLIEIGNHVEITTDVSFITHDGSTWCFRDNKKYKDVIRYGSIIIDDNCFIGQSVIILPNTHIGNNCIIGAGSVVKGRIPDNSVFAGVPARLICSTEVFAEKCLLENPHYSVEDYKANKKKVVLEITHNKQK